MQTLSQIRQIDYTVMFARNMDATRHIYETSMEFRAVAYLTDRWIEYRLGSTTLALTTRGARFNDTPPEQGALSLQVAVPRRTTGGGQRRGARSKPAASGSQCRRASELDSYLTRLFSATPREVRTWHEADMPCDAKSRQLLETTGDIERSSTNSSVMPIIAIESWPVFEWPPAR